MFEEQFKIMENTIEEINKKADTNLRLIGNLQTALKEISLRVIDLQGQNQKHKINIEHIKKYNGMKGRDITLLQEALDTQNREIISLKQHIHELEETKESKDKQVELV